MKSMAHPSPGAAAAEAFGADSTFKTHLAVDTGLAPDTPAAIIAAGSVDTTLKA